jgi:hypothetical protein
MALAPVARGGEIEPDPIDHNADDLIGAQVKMAESVGPALTEDELQTVREAMWKREAEELQHGPARIEELGLFMRLAFAHLLSRPSVAAR